MNILIILAVTFLAACAGLSGPGYELPENLAVLASANDALACRYQKLTNDHQGRQHTANWYFWREPQRTESRDVLSNQGEIWERNQAGQLFYTRLFFNERVALEFVPGDLAATGSTATWGQLSSLIDPGLLGKDLSLLDKGSQNGNVVEYYQGIVNHVAVEVDWLPSLRLPARLSKKLPEGEVTLTLSECAGKDGLDIKPTSNADLSSFKRLDFTDLGDMEDDPLVRHIEQLMGGHHHAGH